MLFKQGIPTDKLISLEDVRGQVRSEDTREDAVLAAALAAASLRLDGPDSVTGLPMLRRECTGLGILAPRIVLEIGPDAVLTSVEVLVSGVWTAVSAGVFALRKVRDQTAMLVLQNNQVLPTADYDEENCRVKVLAGFADKVTDPRLAPVRQACLLLTAHYFENRGAASFGGGFGELPMGVRALIKPFSRAME